jgi:hypothetical protein
MPTFLIRSFDDGCDYTEVFYPTLLPRSKEESYVPWAITRQGRVVYAKFGEHRGFNLTGVADPRSFPKLLPYDTFVSQDRRRLAESALGLYALNNPNFTNAAVKLVSEGVRKYLQRHQFSTPFKEKLLKNLGHYLFTKTKDTRTGRESIGKGFGRISETNARTLGCEGVLRGIYIALEKGRLDQQLSIHDGIGRKMLAEEMPEDEGLCLSRYKRWGGILRQDWFDDSSFRGRKSVATRTAPTTVGGIVRSHQAHKVGTVAIDRNRGVDMFERDPNRGPYPAADAYYDDLDTRNLLFGAGISGTTGTLLQAAFAFGGQLTGELLKQYVFAIIGYLVGGGMHSYHESLAVAEKAGIPYTPGKYIQSLPDTFLASPQFMQWRANYYDIVILGAAHWRFNPGIVPHLRQS